MNNAVALPRKEGVAAQEAQRHAGEHPGLLDRASWRDAALVWLIQRALFIVLTYFGWLLPMSFDPMLPHAVWARPDLPWAVNFDGTMYASISGTGYAYPWQAAFYPLYPTLTWIVSHFTFGQVGAAALLVANSASLGAFALLRVLVEREYGRQVALRALIALAVFPSSLFLAAAYAESLFLLLSLATFLALRRQRWLTAGVFTALATLTRPVGILLLAPLAVEIGMAYKPQTAQILAGHVSWKGASLVRTLRGVLPRIVGALALPVLALGGYFAYLAIHFNSFFAATNAEAAGWGRYLSWPWDGLMRATGALVTARGPFQIHAFLDIVFTLAFIGLAIAMLRCLPPSYTAYAATTLALVLLTPIHAADWAALHSNTRFMVVVFPLFMFIGRWQLRPRLRVALVSAAIWLLAILTASFVNGSWVA